jgi:hypothetical protein
VVLSSSGTGRRKVCRILGTTWFHCKHTAQAIQVLMDVSMPEATSTSESSISHHA